MSTAIEKLQTAQQKAMKNRPKIGGFPYLAEVLRQAGVTSNVWTLPACQSLYVIDGEQVVMQGTPLISGMVDVPVFDEGALIAAIRKDQAGESYFPDFLKATWEAGVVWYQVDFDERTVTYGGGEGIYTEQYESVEL